MQTSTNTLLRVSTFNAALVKHKHKRLRSFRLTLKKKKNQYQIKEKKEWTERSKKKINL